jgi:hypothetical protein
MTSRDIVEDVPALIAPSLSSLQPVTLPLRPRDDLDRILQHLSDNNAGLLVIVADGGLGKSVLLGLAIDRISTRLQPNEQETTTPNSPEGQLTDIRALTFVSCADVATTADLSTLQLLDQALGAAVRPASTSLTSLLLNQREQYGRAALLIDTLDLILTDKSTKLLAQIMRRLLAEGVPIVATCRLFEFDLFFGDISRTIPALTELVKRHRLPYLSPFETVAWAEAYLSQHSTSAENADFLESLESGIRGRGSLRQVCSVPLLLALTCSTFAPLGAVPEDLTVSALYRRYWDDRIANERGLRHSEGARAQESLCLTLAGELLRGSYDRFQLKMRRKASDALSQGGAADRLRSEGVLIQSGIADETFFHQTFAEYTGARYLLSLASPREMNETLQEVGLGKRNSLWPVVTQLLILVDEEDDATFWQLTDNLPLRDSEAARAILLGAIARPTSTVLNDLARKIVILEQQYIDALLDILGDAPIHQLSSALELASHILEVAPVRYVHRAAGVAGRIVARTSTYEQAAALRRVLDATSRRHDELTQPEVGELYNGLLKTLVASSGGVTSEGREVLRQNYQHFGNASRATVLRIHLDASSPMATEELIAAGSIFLRYPAPRLDDDSQVELLLRCFESTSVAKLFGWQSWSQLLYANLPSGWDGSQMRAAARLAEDEDILGSLVSDLLDPDDHDRQRVVNTLKEFGSTHPNVLADCIIARMLPTSKIAVDAASGVIWGVLDFVERPKLGNLSDWLRPAAHIAPREIWPVLAKLAIDNVPALSQILDDLIRNNETNALVGVIDVILGAASGRVTVALEGTLRPLIAGGRSAARRGRLDAILALYNVEFRHLIERDMERTSPATQARYAILTVERRLNAGMPPQPDLASWMASLLRSPHTDAVRRVAVLLSQRDLLNARATWPYQEVLSYSLQRLEAALTNEEDAQLMKALVKLFLDSADAGELTDILALQAIGLLMQFVETSPLRHSELVGAAAQKSSSTTLRAAVYRSLTDLIAVASRRSLNKTKAQELTLTLLRSVDTGDIGGRAWQDLRELLCAVGDRDPSLIDDLERAWPRDRRWNQLAVAEAVLRLDGRSSGGRAHRLVQRADCVDSVRRHVLRLLDV